MKNKCDSCLNNKWECGLEPDFSGCCKGYQRGDKQKKPKYYGMDFQTYPAGVHPTKANTWHTLEEIKIQYEEFCADCEKYGQEPLPHFVYVGQPDGDEEKYGYPDYPDYIISQGPRGGISIRRV